MLHAARHASNVTLGFRAFRFCGLWFMVLLSRLPALYGAYSVVANIIPLFTPSDIKAITRCAKQCLADLFKPRP